MVLGGRKGRRKKTSKPRKLFKKHTPNTSAIQVPMLHSTTNRRNAPLPKRLKATFIYADEEDLNSGAGTIAVHVFSCNGMFDPDVTAAGHQPRGFDQIMPFYDHYTVIAFHIECVYMPVAGENVRFGMFIKDTGTIETTWNDYMEQGSQKVWKCTGSRDNTNARLILNVAPPKYLGITHALSSNVIRGTVGTNPSEGVFCHIVSVGLGTAAVTNYPIQLIITYTVILTEPQQPSQS